MRGALVALALAIGLAGCGLFDDEDRLEGERQPVRAAETQRSGPTARAAALPAPRAVDTWSQTNSNAAHNGGHLAGPTSLSRAWRADAGSGGIRITGAPIVLGETVYVLDGDARLSALAASSGSRAWTVDLSPPGEDGSEGFGGGLAAEGGTVFATTGFGEVLAVEGRTGEILWRQRFNAPFRAAPAVLGGVVVAVARDNQAYGLSASDGRPLWRLQGATAGAGLLGGASPAMAGEVVVLPFASGELVAATRQGGRRAWTAVLSGGRRGMARSAIADVTGDPVLVAGLAVAANQSGRTVAIDAATGTRLWTRSVGSTGPIWAAGETLFVMGDDAVLRRLSLRDGGTVWEAALPAFDDLEDREGAISYSGPVLTSGRVLLTDSEGTLHAFDAASGERVATADIGSGSTLGPVVAGGTVYVLDRDGTLYAFR